MYSDETYLEYAHTLFGQDEGTSEQKYKLVTTRKEHRCAFADVIDREHQIPADSRVLRETALTDSGWQSCYSCLPCVDTWIDHLEKGAEFPPPRKAA